MSTEAVRYFIQGDGNLANPERVDNVDISTVDSVTKAVVADAHKATPGVLYMIKFLDGPEWASPASGKPPRSNDSNKIIVRLTKAPNPAQQQGGLGGQDRFQKRIFNTRSYVVPKMHFVVNPAELNLPTILDHVERREYVLIHGHWQSGKSTHAEYAAKKLRSLGYLVVFIDFQGVQFTSEKTFWISVMLEMLNFIEGKDLGIPAIQKNRVDQLAWLESREPAGLKSNIAAFLADMDKPEVVIIADEFAMLKRNGSVSEGFFDQIRTFRNAHVREPPTCRLRSFIGFGTYDISRFALTELEPSEISEEKKSKSSPFNMSLNDTVPHFTQKQNKALFMQAATEYRVHIATVVINDIFSRVEGHPGLTGECGVLLLRDAKGKDSYTMKNWKFAVRNLVDAVLESETTREILASLSSNNQLAQKARDLLFYHHLLQEAPLPKAQTLQVKDAQMYLLAIGVLVQDMNGSLDFSSPLMRQLLVERFEIAHGGSINLDDIFSTNRNTFDMFKLIVASVRIFRRGIITTDLCRNKSGEIGEISLHFELFHAIRTIFDAREAQLRKSSVDISPFEICCEVKEKTRKSRRRLDVLICNGKNDLLEIKSCAADLLAAAGQAEEYSDYYENVAPYVVAFDMVGVSDGQITNGQNSTAVPIIVVSYDKDFTTAIVRTIFNNIKKEERLVFGSADTPIDAPTITVRGQKRSRKATPPEYPFNYQYDQEKKNSV